MERIKADDLYAYRFLSEPRPLPGLKELYFQIML